MYIYLVSTILLPQVWNKADLLAGESDAQQQTRARGTAEAQAAHALPEAGAIVGPGVEQQASSGGSSTSGASSTAAGGGEGAAGVLEGEEGVQGQEKEQGEGAPLPHLSFIRQLLDAHAAAEAEAAAAKASGAARQRQKARRKAGAPPVLTAVEAAELLRSAVLPEPGTSAAAAGATPGRGRGSTASRGTRGGGEGEGEAGARPTAVLTSVREGAGLPALLLEIEKKVRAVLLMLTCSACSWAMYMCNVLGLGQWAVGGPSRRVHQDCCVPAPRLSSPLSKGWRRPYVCWGKGGRGRDGIHSLYSFHWGCAPAAAQQPPGSMLGASLTCTIWVTV